MTGYPWSKGNTLVATDLNQAIVDRVAKAGDTMTGPLVLSGAPSSNLQAATKLYVDNAIAGIVFPSSGVSRLTTNLTPVTYPGTGTAEVDLQTYTLPAGTLLTDGQAVRVTAAGTCGNLASVRTVRLYFGATSVTVVSPGTGGPFNWDIEAVLWRTGATTQYTRGHAITTSNNTAGSMVTSQNAASETLSGPIIIKTTGALSVAGANAITSSILMVELLP